MTDALRRYFWKRARCWKGERCPFLHEQTPLPPPSGSNVLAPHDSGLQASKLPPLTGLEVSAPDDPELQAVKPGEPVKGSPAWKEKRVENSVQVCISSFTRLSDQPTRSRDTSTRLRGA